MLDGCEWLYAIPVHDLSDGGEIGSAGLIKGGDLTVVLRAHHAGSLQAKDTRDLVMQVREEVRCSAWNRETFSWMNEKNLAVHCPGRDAVHPEDPLVIVKVRVGNDDTGGGRNGELKDIQRIRSFVACLEERDIHPAHMDGLVHVRPPSDVEGDHTAECCRVQYKIASRSSSTESSMVDVWYRNNGVVVESSTLLCRIFLYSSMGLSVFTNSSSVSIALVAFVLHHGRGMNADLNLATLSTETRNPRTTHIDQLSTLEMLTVINQEDQSVPLAVAKELPQIAQAVDEIARRFERGGRLFYIGAGTSGRLGVLDASECPPTFSVPPTLVQGLIAGGDSALRKSSEKSEDSREQGALDLDTAGFRRNEAPDTLIGIAASGRTPYVIGAMEHAKKLGAFVISLTCVEDSEMAQIAEIAISPVTGPEVVTGSTRLKAGTATKLVLNMLSTGVMIRTGAVYGNLMVNVQPTNEKLIDRAQRIIAEATGVDRAQAAELLAEAGGVKLAIAMQKLGLDRSSAETRLAAAGGNLARALA